MTASLKKTLGLMDAISVVSGSMIGSGIFIVSTDIASRVHSTYLLLMIWIIAGIMTIFGAMSYGELAASIPETGGQYIFLKKLWGKLIGFLYGWTFFLVIQSGVIAAVSVAFAKFLGLIVPFVDSSHYLIKWGLLKFSTEQLVAILIIILITHINTKGVKYGVIIQNIFTVAKIASLLGVIICGLFIGFKPEVFSMNFSNFWVIPAHDLNVFSLVAVTLVGALFSSDAWVNLTFIASEIKKPEKNLPMALFLGTVIVIALYLLTNFAYLSVLTLGQIINPGGDIVASAMMSSIFGKYGTVIISVIILISAFGCINGNVLAGARVLYAMAEDRVFFQKLAILDEKNDAPVNALVLQAFWSCCLVLSGSFSQLLDYIMFAALLFYILTVGSVFLLRKKHPEIPTPYKVPLYPYLPLMYCLMATFVSLNLLIYKPAYTWPGLIIVFSGIPVYYSWRIFRKKTLLKMKAGRG